MKDHGLNDETELKIEPLIDFPPYVPLGEVVFQTLKDAILKGALEPGQLLSENKIAAKLKVSRTPVREALRRLEQENLIKTISGRRLAVSFPTVQDVEDIYDIRLLVESEALRKINKDDDSIIRQLEQCLEVSQNQLQTKDYAGLRTTNSEFHSVLVSTLNNRRLEQFIDSLQDTIALYRSYSLINQQWAEDSEHEHAQIIEYLRKGDTEGAVKVLAKHLATAKEVLVSMISEKYSELNGKEVNISGFQMLGIKIPG